MHISPLGNALSLALAEPGKMAVELLVMNRIAKYPL
jgi:hypothetical protein